MGLRGISPKLNTTHTNSVNLMLFFLLGIQKTLFQNFRASRFGWDDPKSPFSGITIDWLIDWMIDSFIHCSIDRLIEGFTHSSIVCLIDCSIDWLIDWMTYLVSNCPGRLHLTFCLSSPRPKVSWIIIVESRETRNEVSFTVCKRSPFRTSGTTSLCKRFFVLNTSQFTSAQFNPQ